MTGFAREMTRRRLCRLAAQSFNQTERAIQDFDQAIKLDPNSVQAFYNRAIAYFKVHQTDRAVRDFDQAIKLDPNNTYALTNRGVVYATVGQYAPALQDFDQAIGLDPNNANAFYDLGLVKQKSGDVGTADQQHTRCRADENHKDIMARPHHFVLQRHHCW
jgi:tetratricopeptide (TPR) repeat protein